MQEAESIVRRAGWLNKCNGNMPELNTEPIEVEDMSLAEWISCVKEARALALKKNKLIFLMFVNNQTQEVQEK